MKKVIIVSILSTLLFTGCVGEIVAAPFNIVGEAIETVVP